MTTSNKTGSRRVIVSGAGIGGLTAALCLARRGIQVQVLEQAGQISEVGAGIQLSPNATRVLDALDLGQAVVAAGFEPQAIDIRDYRSGKSLASEALGEQAVRRYGARYLNIHRADLIDILWRACLDHQAVNLETGSQVTEFTSNASSANSVVVRAAGREFEADLLVGADGIHSRVRQLLFGATEPVFTGHVAWRSIIPADRITPDLIAPVAGAWLGPRAHFVHYYLRDRQLINCVCVVEDKRWTSESWTERGDHTELQEAFSAWHPQIRQLVDSMDRDACFKWALLDRPPMDSWGQGRVTLLGDACHPTLPFMAQGAAMAIEDAAVLATTLTASSLANDNWHTGAIVGALRRYERLRQPRTRQIQRASARNGQIFHADGIAASLRNRVLRFAMSRSVAQTYSYNALDQGV